MKKSVNPFEGWLDHQQNFGDYAVDPYGCAVTPAGQDAVKWCAVGRIRAVKGGFTDDAFELWLFDQLAGGEREVGESSIIFANDTLKWTPAQFRDAYDRFLAAR